MGNRLDSRVPPIDVTKPFDASVVSFLLLLLLVDAQTADAPPDESLDPRICRQQPSVTAISSITHVGATEIDRHLLSRFKKKRLLGYISFR